MRRQLNASTLRRAVDGAPHTNVFQVFLRPAATAQWPTNQSKECVTLPSETSRNDLGQLIDSATIHLWEGYNQPTRRLTRVPFEVYETGHSGFDVQIYLVLKQFQDDGDAIRLVFLHDLSHVSSGHCQCLRKELLLFEKPTPAMRKMILGSGGVGVRSAAPEPPEPAKPIWRSWGMEAGVESKSDAVSPYKTVDWKTARRVLQHWCCKKTDGWEPAGFDDQLPDQDSDAIFVDDTFYADVMSGSVTLPPIPVVEDVVTKVKKRDRRSSKAEASSVSKSSSKRQAADDASSRRHHKPKKTQPEAKVRRII